MLKLFDDIENPYSPSGDRSGRISVHSTGMGPRILSDNKGHDWEELLLMVSTEKDRVVFRQLFNHFAPKNKIILDESRSRSNNVTKNVARKQWQPFGISTTF